MAESEEELKSLLMKVKEESEKVGPGHAGKEGPQLARTGASPGFTRAAAGQIFTLSDAARAAPPCPAPAC